MKALRASLLASVAVLAFAGTANASLVTDTFTGTDGTLLQNHTADSGQTWAKHPNYASDLKLFGGRVYGPEWAMYTSSAVPSSNQYDVSATLTVKSNVGALGVVGRASTSGTDNLYLGRYNAGTGSWELVKCTTSCTVLGSFAQTLTVGSTYALKLEIRDAAKKLYVDGVERISSTDNTDTQVGRAGIRQGPLPTTASTTTGYHLDSFTVDNIAPDTTITGGPSGTTSDPNPSFTFTSTITPATFECKLDGPGGTIGSWGSCSSPKAYTALADGSYTFNVRATAGGLTDGSPATRSFTVATGGGGPPAYTVTFADSFEGATFPQVFATGAWNAGKLLDGTGAYFNQITPSGYSAVDGTKVSEAGLTTSSTRAEIQCHRKTTPDLCAGGEGTEFFYDYSFRVPSDVTIPNQPFATRPNIMQTKPETQACYGGGMVIWPGTDPAKFELRQNIRGGNITNSSGGCTFDVADTVYFMGSFTKGAWHHVVIHAKWSTNAAVGFEEMWIDGVQVLPRQTRPTLIVGETSMMFRLGIYNSVNNNGSGTNWHVEYDNVKVGTP